MSVHVRAATAADAAVIARHRARMFEEMGQLPPDAFDALREAAEAYVADAIARGEYVGWLATPADVCPWSSRARASSAVGCCRTRCSRPAGGCVSRTAATPSCSTSTPSRPGAAAGSASW